MVLLYFLKFYKDFCEYHVGYSVSEKGKCNSISSKFGELKQPTAMATKASGKAMYISGMFLNLKSYSWKLNKSLRR